MGQTNSKELPQEPEESKDMHSPSVSQPSLENVEGNSDDNDDDEDGDDDDEDDDDDDDPDEW